ncbi:MAG: urate hydroxylase PuuD [Elusimicrobia bacterium]|nr:urate hydroxylase PuuD [Elusimicrobiota bacterium]
MAQEGLYQNMELILRWLHVIAGITWIGHLYFFNLVNAVLQGILDDPTKKAVNPKLMPRALWWFRWGAMVTFVVGLLLFTMIYMYTPGLGFGPSAAFSTGDGLTQRAVWILLGMLLGTIMWFNVWFVIWPVQKKILSGKASPEELPVIRKRAGLFSRVNTYLSGPMLVGMLAAQHYGAFNTLTLIVFSGVTLLAVWGAISSSSKVGTSV